MLWVTIAVALWFCLLCASDALSGGVGTVLIWGLCPTPDTLAPNDLLPAPLTDVQGPRVPSPPSRFPGRKGTANGTQRRNSAQRTIRGKRSDRQALESLQSCSSSAALQVVYNPPHSTPTIAGSAQCKSPDYPAQLVGSAACDGWASIMPKGSVFGVTEEDWQCFATPTPFQGRKSSVR